MSARIRPVPDDRAARVMGKLAIRHPAGAHNCGVEKCPGWRMWKLTLLVDKLATVYDAWTTDDEDNLELICEVREFIRQARDLVIP